MDLEFDRLEKRLALFPCTTRIQDEVLTVAGHSLAALAEEFGTPLYLYDQATLEAAVNEYQQVLSEVYPGPAGITYAGKAYLSLAMAQWVVARGLMLDCTGAGEIAIAQAADAPRSQVLMHGVNKSRQDLDAACEAAGTIVIDNLAELTRWLQISSTLSAVSPHLWLRLRPGLAVDTHAYTQTGQEDSKFGMSAGEICSAVAQSLKAGLPLTGLHFHQGSHFHDPSPLEPAIESVLDLVVELRSNYQWTPEVICVGGGWGVPYHEDDLPHLPVRAYIEFVARCLEAGCRQRQLVLPRLQVEPGRSLVARAGIAVYQVETIKHTAHRRWLLLDGGMADNPRPALYRARYTCLPVQYPGRPAVEPAWLAGPYCESGDVLIENLLMPEVAAGEWVAIPVSGAYHLSMSSNYNGARRPAVVWLKPGQANLIQRRETPADLLRCDLPWRPD